jgi:hypothetical protein
VTRRNHRKQRPRSNEGETRELRDCGETRLARVFAPLLNYATMPQFVIEREVAGAGSLSEPEIRELSLRSLSVLKEMGPQIQWLHSYVTEDKVYCVYLAPDENTIREHARKVGLPADRVSAVRRLIDPVKLT